MTLSVGGWFLDTAVPALRVSPESIGSLFETTTGLVKRGGTPRESRMNYAALAVGILFVLLAGLMFAVRYSPLFYYREYRAKMADLMLGMNKRSGTPPVS